MAESQPQAQGGQLIWRKASPGPRGGSANIAKSQPQAQGGQLIQRKASPGLQNYFQRNQISRATSRFPDVIAILSSFNQLYYFKNSTLSLWYSNLLLSLVLFKKLIKLRCINRIKDVNKNTKRAFFSLFFKEAFFILFSRSQQESRR